MFKIVAEFEFEFDSNLNVFHYRRHDGIGYGYSITGYGFGFVNYWMGTKAGTYDFADGHRLTYDPNGSSMMYLWNGDENYYQGN